MFVAKMQVARNMNTEARITMGNNGKKTEEKRRNYWIIGLVLASSVILLYVLIYLSFAGKGFIPTGKYLTKGGLACFFWYIFILCGGDISKCNSIGTNSHLCEKATQPGLSCSKETDSTNLFGGDY